MAFKEVNEMPKTKRTAKHDLRGMLKEFVESDKRIVKVQLIESDYKRPLYAYKSLMVAAKRDKLPVKLHYRDGEVYISKE